ncbi:ubiquitin carboxyl-terminal hydrolase, putative [Theileria annulata]|uniref:Ubiquitin carboxyl-terminal hydrolase, putative n=1 Tax=Theileria annulata TaxID=5874 RepID=Q4UBT6_THEAN|nr:ubiquitin carboxyl-terminal hydrolase, putative [Theileria annulata]CAI75715.1 ubiquitin carboxyl-terminal hydrolase, putative [Theileria annulata]|eukprot:XP_955191.1 ubiquitin carboxyl-terminal hydrolase, putative [Theileria annulata]
MSQSSDSSESMIPPPMLNETELVVSNFRDKVIGRLSLSLQRGDSVEKIKEVFSPAIYSEWKELPNFVFRIMLFPVCPHTEDASSLSQLKISAYIEAKKRPDWPENWICYGTRFTIIVINVSEPHASIFKRDSFNFSRTETDRGWQGIISHSQILENGFLNRNGDLILRAGVYPTGPEIDRSARDPNYNCRLATGFVGLQNHGATCYMNALLQSLYSITKFRKSVYSLNFDLNNLIGQKSFKIIQKYTNNLQNKDEEKMELDNPYPESNLPTSRPSDDPYSIGLDMDWDEVLDELEEKDYCNLLLEEEVEKRKAPSLSLALQNLFYLLNYSETPPACKELMKSFGWDSSDMFTQQDSHELLKLLLDKMEEQMKGTPVEGSVKNIFEGEMETYIECIDIEYKSCRRETFEDIQLDVQGCDNIYESLDKLTAPELLAGENMYEAKGHGKQRANKGIRFLKFPPVVIFLLKRFTFDLSKMDTVKLNNRFEFYKEISLSQYIQNDTNKIVDGDYVLQAVSVHHGSINSGHYYAFAKNEDSWFRFDDEIVTRVSEYAAINDNFGGEDQECYNYLTTNPNNPSIYSNHMNRYRRSKVYNAYILIYVLKSKKDEILGEVDMLKENYQMLKRYRIQRLLHSLRSKTRERLNSFVKVKVFTPEEFEGNTLLNQHFNTWPNKLVLKHDKSNSISELISQITDDLDIEEDSYVNYYVLGLNKQFNKFLSISDLKNKHKIPVETISDLVQLLRREYYQQFDPTLYLLKTTSAPTVDSQDTIPKNTNGLFVPSINISSTSLMQRSASLLGSAGLLKSVAAEKTFLIIKYYDIFTKDHENNLKCLKMVYINPQRNVSQLVPLVVEQLINFMSNNLVTPYRLKDLNKLLENIRSGRVSEDNLVNTSFESIPAETIPKSDTDTNGFNSDTNTITDVELNLNTNDTIDGDEDRRINMLMRNESLHLCWFIEIDNNFSNLALGKKLEDQLTNGDVLVCNFRPTDEMRQEIEQVEKKTNQKEDFETTKPSFKSENTNHFIISSSEIYLKSMGLEPDESLKQYRNLQQKWSLEQENKLKLHQLYNFSIYDYPSFIQWKLNNIQVTFKLYDPLQLLSTWKNCSNSIIHTDSTNGVVTNGNTGTGTVTTTGTKDSTVVPGTVGTTSTKDTPTATVTTDNVDDVENIKSIELVVDLRMPCKHILRYVSWLLGVDPCHVLIFNGNPQNFETIGSHLYSLDDFSNRDNSLGYTQKPLIHLFTIQGNLVMPNNLNLYHNPASARLSQRLSQSLDPNLTGDNTNSNLDTGNNTGDPTSHSTEDNANTHTNVDTADPVDTIDPNVDLVDQNDLEDIRNDYDELEDLRSEYDDEGMGRRTGRYNLRLLNSFRRQTHEENVIHMGVLFEPYYNWNYKFNDEMINIVGQIFNEKAQIISALMCKVPTNFTVGQLCNFVSNNYESLNSSNKRVKQTRTDSTDPALLLVDVITSLYTIVDLDTKVLELPQYSNTSIRNLFSAPLRFVPNWTPEQHELIHQKKLCPLTVFHQTSDHEYFGHPFQVLVPPTWNFLQIKTHIKNTLDVPKKLWDRWTFYQVTDSHARTWKSNDDLLDWDNSNIKLLAEHPKPYEKSKNFGIMKIT